jgi:glycogen phosphorylase
MPTSGEPSPAPAPAIHVGAAPVAYFSMEIALESHVPTYSGGLGVLAGDLLRSAADRRVPMLGVSLVHRHGYLFQRIDAQGLQTEEPVHWSPDDWLEALDSRCTVEIEGRQVTVKAWRFHLSGVSGGTVPIYLLDTDLPDNDPYDRRLTDVLYGGDARYRLCQEVVLGIGGVRMLRALGHADIVRFHMNEGHSALLALELLREQLATSVSIREAAEAVAKRCVFTTHTPVPAGHDQFPRELAAQVLGSAQIDRLKALDACGTSLNMTLLALHLSHYVNGVTRRHGEISRSMFPGYPIGSITNGVHSPTWTAPAFRTLYDRWIPGWRQESWALRHALNIPLDEIRRAHDQCKRALMQEINERANAGFDKDILTMGFARRATAYKRPLLILKDPERLRDIARTFGGLQIVFAGKAHPHDAEGKALIQTIMRTTARLAPEVRIAFLVNYDMTLAQLVTAGVDVWLNTPRPPFEASGASGMKAAHNGVPMLSSLDGWWVEGCIEGVTGWPIAVPNGQRLAERSDDEDASDLYRVLAERIAPVFTREPDRWLAIMRTTIAVNAAFFNTHRMLDEYVRLAYEG